METRTLGDSDLVLSRLGCGAWAIGGGGWEFGWGAQDDRHSVAAILRSLELGVNWVDTAAVYGLGHSEEVVARALAAWPGPRPYVFTKCGLRWDNTGNVRRTFAAQSIREECEDSLRRLAVDAIDLYQMHWPPADSGLELEEAWTTMASLQEEGKVRWIGVSNFDVAEIRRAHAIAAVTSVQSPYSLIRRGVETATLRFCQQHGIGAIGYSPMASGLLSGAMTRERAAAMPPGDFRSRNVEYRQPALSRNLALVDRLRKVGDRHGRLPGEVAIAWVLRNPEINGAIVGVRSAQQADQMMSAASLRLTDAEAAYLEGASTLAAGHRQRSSIPVAAGIAAK